MEVAAQLNKCSVSEADYQDNVLGHLLDHFRHF